MSALFLQGQMDPFTQRPRQFEQLRPNFIEVMFQASLQFRLSMPSVDFS